MHTEARPGASPRPPDAAALERTAAQLARAQARFCADWLHERGPVPAFATFFRALVALVQRDPQRVQALQQRYYEAQLDLWRLLLDPGSPAPAQELEADPRFRASEWREIAWFDYLRRSYAQAAQWLRELVAALDLDAAERRRLGFYVQQFIDASAPSNFAYTNPEALKLAFASGGESLARGLKNLLDDAAKGRVSMTDERAFEVGRNLAVTPGAVVFRNELFELLQYRPATAKVRRRPLVIVPPCINKYYILDLRPENSFVRFAVESGLTVFMISWRDIPTALGHYTWDRYIDEGVIRAIEVARDIGADPKVNVLGFCVGGTLAASALAVLRRKRRRPAASLTLLASLLDFGDSGDIGVYVDEAYVAQCERDLGSGGILPGSRLAAAFASLRANDLVWRYVVENYLKGRTPPPFDLLYWNSDSANLPGPMYAYYLRNMYLRNSLCKPDALTMCGVPVDVGRIGLPAYVLATEADHIVPWRSAYASARLLGEDVCFVLGASGHIAGVVNPPQDSRRHYRTARPHGDDPEAWLQTASKHPGSWWPHWAQWLEAHSGPWIAAPPAAGSARYPELEPAPGRYVRAREAQPPST